MIEVPYKIEIKIFFIAYQVKDDQILFSSLYWVPKIFQVCFKKLDIVYKILLEFFHLLLITILG